MTNFEYLKTLDIKGFVSEFINNVDTYISDSRLEEWLKQEKTFYTNIVGYIIDIDIKYLENENITVYKKHDYVYITKPKLTGEDLFDFVRHIAVYCKFALITYIENSIEHHLVVHDGMWSDELVRNFERY